MRKLISILNPVYWTTAQEVGEAVNGYTLTGGTFRRETQVEFATGATLFSTTLQILYIHKLHLLFEAVNSWC